MTRPKTYALPQHLTDAGWVLIREISPYRPPPDAPLRVEEWVRAENRATGLRTECRQISRHHGIDWILRDIEKATNEQMGKPDP